MLLASLSAAQKAGIAGMGAAFIIFALVSSFVVPRYRPNFPGRRVWPYVGLVVCFFAAMMAAGRSPRQRRLRRRAPRRRLPGRPRP